MHGSKNVKFDDEYVDSCGKKFYFSAKTPGLAPGAYPVPGVSFLGGETTGEWSWLLASVYCWS